LSPTFTNTPTITNTPANTNTPTITPTFTVTGSVTMTPTPDKQMYLSQNFFNPNTQPLLIDFRVDNPGQVRICVFNIIGEEIVKLVDQNYAAGNYQTPWDGKNRFGDMVGNSTYFILIQAPDGHMVRQVIVLK